MKKKSGAELVSNRRGYYDYEVLETYEAGIALLGTEIKSLRDHGGSLQDAYVLIDKGEAYLKQASIAPYKFGSVFNHNERRKRKLLLHRHEITKLKKQIEQKGLTIIPLSMYLKKGYVKVKLGVAKGKKRHDKRQAIREREEKRSIDRILKRGS